MGVSKAQGPGFSGDLPRNSRCGQRCLTHEGHLCPSRGQFPFVWVSSSHWPLPVFRFARGEPSLQPGRSTCQFQSAPYGAAADQTESDDPFSAGLFLYAFACHPSLPFPQKLRGQISPDSILQLGEQTMKALLTRWVTMWIDNQKLPSWIVRCAFPLTLPSLAMSPFL